ncbi:Nuclear protein DGCR14 [Lasallia pustulata]|uniref:Nuclear protein DGCR14 n=1 Tax=Lasallia pustulata TaxID=136370 RepID=A0A1W5D776_9LECA|nr:Nuclear protein DGCR14 [Lasallia pustulata]
MASVSNSQALAKRSSDTALMPPPPRPKRIKRPAKVLDEDTYTDALSNIIARDFFPGLVETESQQEYLNALDSHDDAWIAAAGRKLTEVMTPGPDGRRLRGKRGTSMTPTSRLFGRGGETPKGWGGDTPMSVVSTSSTATSQTEKPEVDTNMSLSAFQTKYTSEDNESFYKLLDKQNLKRAEKQAWMWSGNKIPSARQIAHRQRSSRLLEAKAAQDRANGGKALLSIEAPDTRKAMPDAWPSRPDNPLMDYEWLFQGFEHHILELTMNLVYRQHLF